MVFLDFRGNTLKSFLVLFFLIHFASLESKEFIINDFSKHLLYQKNFIVEEKLVAVQENSLQPQPIFFEDFQETDKFNGADVVWRTGYVNQAPFFYNLEAKLEIPSFVGPNLEAIKSFNISFYFKSAELFQDGFLLKKDGFIEGAVGFIPKRLAIYVKNGYVYADFVNFFQFSDKFLSLSLQSSSLFKGNQWNFFSIDYDHRTGFMQMKINGERVDFNYSTPTNSASDTIYYPNFNFNENSESLYSPYFLGEDFLGLIDEVRFYNSSVDAEELIFNRKIYQATYRSKVFRIEPNIALNRINFSGAGIASHELNFYLCTQKTYFNPLPDFTSSNCQSIAWDQELNFENFTSYFQFFIVLKNNRELAREINQITIDYRTLPPLLPPIVLATWVSRDKVVINWRKDPNPAIDSYVIHYSTDEWGDNLKKIIIDFQELTNIATKSDEYAYIISGLAKSENYYFALTSQDSKNNRSSTFSNVKSLFLSDKVF